MDFLLFLCCKSKAGGSDEKESSPSPIQKKLLREVEISTGQRDAPLATGKKGMKLPQTLQNLISNASGNSFFKSVVTLMSGTILSQGILVLSTPLLTRLYTPEEFGIYSVYISILYSLSILASLLYEAAIPLPKHDNDAFHLLVLSLFALFAVSTIVALLIGFFQKSSSQLFHNFGIEDTLWLLPFSLIGFGLFQILNSWLIRNEGYGFMAKGKVAMNLSQLIFQLSLFPIGKLGLVIGEVLGRFGGSFSLTLFVKKSLKSQLKHFSINKMFVLAARYRRFPLITSWASILNVISYHLPSLFIAASFGPAVAGWYLLSQRVLAIPDSLLGFSVKQVYLAKATKMVRTSDPQLHSLFWKTLSKMAIISLIVAGGIALIGPFVFSFIFGEDWGEAGKYVQILAILSFFQLIVGPIASNFYIFERQGLQLAAETIRCSLIMLTIWFCSLYPGSALKSITLLSMGGAAGYIILALFSWLSLHFQLKENKRSIHEGSS